MRVTRNVIIQSTGFALILWALVVTTEAAAAPAGRAALERTGLQPQELRPHDRCLICDGELDADDGLAFLYRGRRITLDHLHLPQFLAEPSAYFSRLQPRGALFQESGGSMSNGWLILGVWVLLGLVGAAVCTGVALRKGLPPRRWFAAGLVANVAAVVLVLTRAAPKPVALPPGLARIPDTAAPYRCARCGGQNHPSAARCRDCGAGIVPTTDSEVERAGLRSGDGRAHP